MLERDEEQSPSVFSEEAACRNRIDHSTFTVVRALVRRNFPCPTAFPTKVLYAATQTARPPLPNTACPRGISTILMFRTLSSSSSWRNCTLRLKTVVLQS